MDWKGHVLIAFNDVAIREVTSMVPVPAPIMMPLAIPDDVRVKSDSVCIELGEG